MRVSLILCAFLACSKPALANDWEKFFTPMAPPDELIPSSIPPEKIPSSGDFERDIDILWERGYSLIGYTDFTTGNSKTSDAISFARKIKARFVILNTELVSSQQTSIPLTLPNATTSYSNGTMSGYGGGGSYYGSYRGQTTTYGSSTTYIPMTVNRFRKGALYFKEVPKVKSGLMIRELTVAEVQKFETRRAFAVRAVRDGSPAYNADILPGDIILTVNGKPADYENWLEAMKSEEPVKVHLSRNNQFKDLMMSIPPEWRPK